MSRIFSQTKVDNLMRQRDDVLASMKAMVNRAEDAGREFTSKENREYQELDKKVSFLDGQIQNEDEQVVHAAMRPLVGNGTFGGGVPNPFSSFGDFMASVRKAGMPGHQPDDRLFNVAGLSTGTPSEGGFLLHPEYSSDLLNKTFEGGAILSRIRRLPPISTDSNLVRLPLIDESSRRTGSRWGGIRVYRSAERADLQESGPQVRLIELPLKKLTGYCTASDEIVEDSSLLGMIVSEGFREEFQFTLEDEILRGDGVSQMLGILNSPCLITVDADDDQDAKTITFSNVTNMWARLPAPSQNNAVWLVNQDCMPALFQMPLLMGSIAMPAFLPAGAWGQPTNMLFGRPVIPIEYAGTIGSKSDIILADFSQYIYADKGEMRSATSIHVLFKSDETAFRFVLRCNGQPTWSAPRTPYQGAATVSPFVTLEART